MNWLNNKIERLDQVYYKNALDKQAQLTKPKGSLGQLEEIAVRLAAMQRIHQPMVDNIWVSVFAADHGVAQESVSAFPQVVTAEMVKNFANDGAAVNVLSNYLNAKFEVIDVGLVDPITDGRILSERAGNGTANFAYHPAMTEMQMQSALISGKSAVLRAIKSRAQLFIGGEMGIANTTSASAIAASLIDEPVHRLTGIGTGLDSEQVQHKIQVITSAIKFHQIFLENPLKVLQYLGGFEIAALVGAYIFSAQQGLPVLIDGFIASVAALLVININPEASDWFFYAHRSEERGHNRVLEELKAKPLLDLNMRLGEASGALIAVPLLQMACKLYNEMATFQQAEITIKNL